MESVWMNKDAVFTIIKAATLRIYCAQNAGSIMPAFPATMRWRIILLKLPAVTSRIRCCVETAATDLHMNNMLREAVLIAKMRLIRAASFTNIFILRDKMTCGHDWQ
jgi:hypothetical protein